MAMAQRYHGAAGHADIIQAFTVELVKGAAPEADRGNYFLLHLLRTHAGVPFTDEWGALLKIEQRSGRLLGYLLLENLPIPPSLLLPNLSESEARPQMVAKVFALFPMLDELVEIRQVRLGIWRPPVDPSGYRFLDLTPLQQTMGQENQGILVYWSVFNQVSKRGAAKVILDAQTGSVLAVEGHAGGGFPGGYPKRAAFEWGIGPGQWEVFRDSRRCAVSNGRVELTKPPSKSEAGIPVILRVEKLHPALPFLSRSRTSHG
jgi:hypothetical protein